MGFTDQIHLLLKAGDGGNGCDSYFHRTDKKSVPNGGDGGIGGNIILKADHNAQPLSALRFNQHHYAESGAHGGSNKKRGRNGKDLTILVPIGTRIFDRSNKFLIRELVNDGDEVIVVKGGKGGLGNAGGKQATYGKKGEGIEVDLLLKIKADAFLVGTPNAGKSALMNKLTRTHLKEEAYPFTTKTPALGVYEKSDFEQMTLCEIPSIYQGSDDGHGCGNRFLKHLEGAALILYVVAPDAEFFSSAYDAFKTVQDQISLFDKSILDQRFAVVVNKIDCIEELDLERQSWEKFSQGDVPVFFISVKTGEGVEDLTSFLNQQIASQDAF